MIVSLLSDHMNYRKNDGGIIDMLLPLAFLLDNVFGKVSGICIGATYSQELMTRQAVQMPADDAAYATGWKEISLHNSILPGRCV